MANFFENLSTKRMVPIGLALFGFSILIFLVEEYVEDNDYDGDFELKASASHLKQAKTGNSEKASDECYRTEPFAILQKCIPCSEFETKAIKAEHCAPTGFFDRLNCTTSGKLVLRPCYKAPQTSQFYKFVVFNGILTAVAYTVALKRKEFLDSKAYTRLQQI